ncbi:MAG TPA: glycosyltransferase family 39 protein [Candidatus Bilamarchaeum sp.]|nr:glycosyltransferase family 39 protein [Candidatus Bilamarchaeum sp.]
MREFFLCALLFLLLCVPYLSFPPDDDVGSHLMMAKGILEGKKLYSDYLDNKGPMLYISLVPVVILAGTSLLGLRLLALALDIGYAFLLYLTVKRNFGPRDALISAALFFLLALDPLTEAFEFRAELFIGLAMCAMISLILESRRDGRGSLWAGVGLALGYAVLIKPSMLILLIPIALFIPKKARPAIFLIAGLAVAAAAFVIALQLGLFSLGDYVDATIVKPSLFAQQVAVNTALPPLLWIPLSLITFPMGMLCILCFLHTAASFRALGHEARVFCAFFATLFIALLFGALSAIGIYNALLLIFLPLVPLIACLALKELESFHEKPAGLKFILNSASVFVFLYVIISLAVSVGSSFLYGQVPGLNAEDTDLTSGEFGGTLSFLSANTGANDSILVFALMPSFYYYSGRPPASAALWFAPIDDKISYYSPDELQALLFRYTEERIPKYVIFDTYSEKDQWVVDRISADYAHELKIGRITIYSRREGVPKDENTTANR